MNDDYKDNEASDQTDTRKGSGLQIVFDPFRLAGSVIERCPWIILGAACGFLCLGSLALLKVKNHYEASARLIKRDPPNTLRAGEIGEPFKPRSLSTPTLVSSALSDNVLARVSAQSQPRISPGLLRLYSTASELRGTDFLQITVNITHSPQAASDLVNLWAKEIVEFTQELQARESREVRSYLQQQLDSTDAELKRVNQDILDFSHREDLVDADKQTDVFLRQLADLDLRYETARIDLNTVDFRLKALEKELSTYSPSDDRLAAAKAALQDALGRYTNENPIVQNLQAKVDALVAGNQGQRNDPTLAEYATTSIGSNLYLQLIDLRSKKDGAEKQLAGLEGLRKSARERIEQLPEKIAELTRLRLVERSLNTSRQLLTARLRETTLYSENAPGYYQVFSSATPESVAISSRIVKIAIYSIAGLILGAAGGLFYTLVRELFDQRLRSAWEARRIFQAPILCTLEPGADPTPETGKLWVNWATPAALANRPAVLWAPRPDSDEDAIWSALLAEARRLQPELSTIDAGRAPGPALADTTRIAPSKLTLEAAKAATREHKHAGVWIRLSGDTVEPTLTLAREWSDAVLIIPADTASISTWQAQARMIHEAGITLSGLIVTQAFPWWKRRPSGIIPNFR